MIKPLNGVCLLVVLLFSSPASAAYITFAGLGVYQSNSSGDATGLVNFFYSSDSVTSYPAVGVTKTAPTPASQQFTALNIPLELGNNTFNLNVGFNAGGHEGIVLFFSGDNTSYNPAVGTARVADLAAFAPTYTVSSFAIPVAATPVHDFTQNATVSYSGATFFEDLGGHRRVTVTALTFPDESTGTLTLTVTQVPEPTSISLLGISMVAFARFVRRRRKQIGVK